MKKILKWIYFFFCVVIFSSCSTNDNNFIILVDLSSFQQKDDTEIEDEKNIIKNIFEEYKQIVKKNTFVSAKNSFELLFVSNNRKIKEGLEYNIKINLKDTLVERRKNSFIKFEKEYITNINKVYEDIKQNDTLNISSCDIWEYFNQNIEDKIDKDKKYSVIILANGYLDSCNIHNKSKNKDKYSNIALLSLVRNNFLEKELEIFLKLTNVRKYEIFTIKSNQSKKNIIKDFLINVDKKQTVKKEVTDVKSTIVDKDLIENEINNFIQQNDTIKKIMLGNEIIKKFSNRHTFVKLTYNNKPKNDITIEEYLNTISVIPYYKKYYISVTKIIKDNKNYIKLIYIDEKRK
ncbi:MAG: hypothetical protein EAZ85_03045 [Bacteroidetes bacterium]|nr:MAG: hypothetical protein EAZ85_03045 [Bacteroidota bacterium]